MISNLRVLRRVFGTENEEYTKQPDECVEDERPPPKLRSKLRLFLALIVLTALGEITLRGIRKRRRERAA